MTQTLVTFHAHPDDESLLTAGVMAKAAAEGHRVVLVVATAGEVGDAATTYGAGADLGPARRAELERSAAILGVHRVVHLGFRDSGLDDTTGPTGATDTTGATDMTGATDATDMTDRGTATPASPRFVDVPLDEAAERLAAVLREEDADVLTVYDPNGGYGHPDHRRVHEVGYRAAERAETPVVLEATINRDLMTMGVELAASLGYEIPDSFTPASFDHWFMPADALTHAVDVGAFIDRKRASMAAHESQATSAAEGTRTLAAFLSLPDEYFALAFGTEWFIDRRRAPGIAADDVFAPRPVVPEGGTEG